MAASRSVQPPPSCLAAATPRGAKDAATEAIARPSRSIFDLDGVIVDTARITIMPGNVWRRVWDHLYGRRQ